MDVVGLCSPERLRVESSPLFRSMYGNEGAAEVVGEKNWKMNTGLQVVKEATVKNWQHNDFMLLNEH